MKLLRLAFLFALCSAKKLIATFRLSEDGTCPGFGGEAILGLNHCFRVVHNSSGVSALVGGSPIAVDEDELAQTFAPASWGLDRIDQEDLPLDHRPLQTPYSGEGQDIYVLDTGVFAGHRGFGGRARQIKSFVDGEDNADLNGHGTHVAGIAAGKKHGVAKKARVLGIKCLGRSGTGAYSGVIRAIYHAVKTAGGKPSVISMSLGGRANKAVNTAVRDAYAAGHVVVVAAGNAGADACDFSPAGQGGKGGVITVMASTDLDSKSGFSNTGKCADIFAPGSEITSAWIGGRARTRTISGTSMAAPHVAGVLALLLQKHGGDRALAISELYALAARRRLSGVPGDTKNWLLQVPRTGAPVTLAPTVYEPPRSLRLCTKFGRTCFDFQHSLFGAPEIHLYEREPIEGEVYLDPTDGCELGKKDPLMRGKIVLVDRGGCLFFNKVKRGEFNGAAAVLIVQYRRHGLQVPHYKGDGSTALHSAMVPFKMRKAKGVYRFGYLLEGSTGVPTPRPTKSTRAPPACACP